MVERLYAGSDKFFEHKVVELLVAMGSLHATQRRRANTA
jgi:hypothetical protein